MSRATRSWGGERQAFRGGRLAREHVVLPLAPELNAGSPQRRLPDPCGALEPECERTTRTIEETADPFELRFAADDVLESEPSFPDCRQRLPPFPRAYAGRLIPATRRRNVWGGRGKSLGISPFRLALRRRSLESVTTYLIEAYVAGGDLADLEDRARAAAEAMSNEGTVTYLRSVLVRADDLLSSSAGRDIVTNSR
jgi:hypothetical protein